MLVAESGGYAHGFAAVMRLRPDEAGMPRDGITALFFADDAAGQALLDRCEQQRPSGAGVPLLAFPNTYHYCPVPGYNGGWDGLSDRLHSGARLLARNGYRPFYRELHLTCDLDRFAARPSIRPTDVVLVDTADERGRRTLRVLVGNRSVGVCVFSTLERLSDDPETRDWGYIWGFGVDEEQRGRGIGRFLLTSALSKLHTSGCQGCWVTNRSDNWPALTLYLQLGFELVDTSTSYTKS